MRNNAVAQRHPMPKQVSEQEQAEIENILRDRPDGA
jgi:hypothetical protein